MHLLEIIQVFVETMTGADEDSVGLNPVLAGGQRLTPLEYQYPENHEQNLFHDFSSTDGCILFQSFARSGFATDTGVV